MHALINHHCCYLVCVFAMQGLRGFALSAGCLQRPGTRRPLSAAQHVPKEGEQAA